MNMPDQRLAEARLLADNQLDQRAVARALDGLMRPGIDAADLYFQSARSESWVLEDGIVREGAYNIDQGVGIRAMAGEKTGFAYSDEIAVPALESAVNAASAIARQGESGAVQAWQGKAMPSLYTADNPLDDLNTEAKLSMLRSADARARAADTRVKQVTCSLTASHELVLVAASDGTWATDVRPLVRMNVQVVAVDGERRERAVAGAGGRYGLSRLLADNQSEHLADEAVRQALVALEGVDAPAGTMPVVLGPGWPAVLLHEAVGHGLEGDFNRKGSSAFSGRIGERVAAEGVTVVDDGSLPERRGSLSVDDEGTQTRCTTLIEDGILRGYMQDKHNARLMGMQSTGNGRRESYARLPMPRMTNTYMLNGQHEPDEIISSVKKGLYAVNFGGGQVDITNGQFVFSANEAYLIEDGRITRPVKGATLIGNGPEALKQVDMIGNDMALDSGIGVCGKNGQGVPVGVGQPTLRIAEMTVGGTSC